IWNNEELIETLKSLDGSDISYYLNDFYASVTKYMADHIHDFEAEDWCLVYYLVYKYLLKDNDVDDLIGFANVLKQDIKIHFTSNTRRPIPLNSNFYKILSVVELETFYAD